MHLPRNCTVDMHMLLAQGAGVVDDSCKTGHTASAGTATAAAQETDLPGDREEFGRVVAHSQTQPLWVVILQDAERFHCQGGWRCVAVAVALKIYEPCHLADTWFEHNSPHRVNGIWNIKC